jgi:DNA replication and repair protein RecF
LRRKWIDGIISQFDRHYLDNIQKYSKVLDQRNALLKNMHEHGLFDRESIEVWNDQMIRLGNEIHSKRKEFVQEFIPVFQSYYQFIGEESEVVKLEYRSALNDCSFEELLEQNRRKDSQSQFTTGGTHKDDLLFTIKGHPVKKFGSQGQQKSFLIALRLAQFDWLKKHFAKKPVLMLDDIFDKLDHQRVEKLMSLVSDHVFGQVLVTDTESERIKAVFSKIDMEYQIFNIDSSTFQEVVYE